MNLIEKYGSYDAAKAKQQELSKIAADPQLLLVGKIIKEIGEIEIALLEYRRQHNIFEIKDKVVSRCADKEIRIFTYQETIGKNILVKCKKGKGYCYPKKWFSHANDAEIKAGKRLEVNQ